VNRAELLAVMRGNRYAIEATVTPTGAPQAAVIGVAVTDAFEMCFDTLGGFAQGAEPACQPTVRSRARRLLRTGDERTLQYEGLADEPAGRSCSV
jgi:hypothetical protein